MTNVIEWLLEGDPAIRWQTLRDLKQKPYEAARKAIARKGWGQRILALQDADGRWGGGLYNPKWTSTTYTLLLLRAFGLSGNSQARRAATLLLDAGLYTDDGMNFWPSKRGMSETCITGMGLQIASCFLPIDNRADRLAGHLLSQQMPDGGWNCKRPQGATHSSMHTTILALEGLLDYERAGGKIPVQTARGRAHEFLFAHRMFRSHRTGTVISTAMTRFPFPPQWHYDVLRGLDYLQSANAPRDARLTDAIDLVQKRQRPDGTWSLQSPHKGPVHFEMESVGQPSRWNTLRALRVLRWWDSLSGA